MYYFKLLRPLNLLFIALSMYGLAWYLELFLTEGGIIFSPSFFILVVSTVCIAGAGNVINDFYDQEIDAINKPLKRIVGLKIKERRTIIFYAILNLFAITASIYLMFNTSSLLLPLIYIVCIFLLWIYSFNLKKSYFIGNVIVAGMTSLIPIVVGLFFQLKFLDNEIYTSRTIGDIREMDFLNVAFFLSTFAFLLNMAREIIKDVEDIKGDLAVNSKSIPIKIGSNKAKILVNFIVFLTVMYSIFFTPEVPLSILKIKTLLWIAMIFVIIASFLLIKANYSKDYRKIQQLFKISIAIGLSLPVYWKILILYS